MENTGETAIRQAVGEKIVASLEKLNKNVMDVFKKTVLQGNQVENEDSLIKSSILIDFRKEFEAEQTKLQSNLNREDLTDLKQQQITSLKAQIAEMKAEQEEVNREINKIITHLVKQ